MFWAVAGQRLYLFYSEQTRASFLADPGRIFDTAERKWPESGTWGSNFGQKPVQRLVAAACRISPGDKGRHAKILGGAAKVQGQALRGRYAAARGNDERLTGGHIPFAGGRQARVHIDAAFRDLANLSAEPLAERVTGPSFARKASVAGSKCERLTAATGAFAWPCPRADRLSLVGAILQQAKPLGLDADNAAPDFVHAPARQ